MVSGTTFTGMAAESEEETTIICEKTPSRRVGVVIPGTRAADRPGAPVVTEKHRDNPNPHTAGETQARYYEIQSSVFSELRAAMSFV
jgi:hypothetical protein